MNFASSEARARDKCPSDSSFLLPIQVACSGGWRGWDPQLEILQYWPMASEVDQDDEFKQHGLGIRIAGWEEQLADINHQARLWGLRRVHGESKAGGKVTRLRESKLSRAREHVLVKLSSGRRCGLVAG